MLFELHITVDTDFSDKHVDAWKKLCTKWGHKPLLIGLAANDADYPKQLMNAVVFDADSVEDAFERMCRLVANYGDEYVGMHRFRPIRAKLEMPLDHSAGVSAAYYEAHAKMLLEPNDVVNLALVTNRDIMHVSQNVLKVDDAGREKWYATKRSYGSDMFSAASAFNKAYELLLSAIPDSAIVRMEKEAVIFDSNHALDKGWATV